MKSLYFYIYAYSTKPNK